MNTWYFTLIFIFSCLGMGKFLINLIINLMGNNPRRIENSIQETIFYGLIIAYFLTYLIYI